MELTILKVADKGNLEKERVILKVNRDCNLGWFIVMDNTYTDDGKLSNLWRHCNVLPKINAKDGDFVWLYTKKGNFLQRGNDSHTSTYEVYWGLDVSIWNKEEDDVHLIRYIDSETKTC